MANISTKIKDSIGKMTLFGQGKQPPPRVGTSGAATAKTAPAPSPSQYGSATTIHRHIEPELSTTTMSRDALKARRLARVEHAANLVESQNVKVMLHFLDGLCLIGPFWILVFTTSEVGQLFTHKPFNWQDQTSVNLYATALFGECILAGLTFLWQYAGAYHRTLESESVESKALGRWITGMACTWAVFAAISALGQFVYLRGIWQPTDPFGYVLIVGRVTLYTVGDWACAKYLGWRVTTLRKIALEEKAKGEIYALLEQQEAERIRKEAEADLHLRQIELHIQSQERNARMANDVQEIMGQAATKFLGQFTTAVDAVMNNVLANVNERLQLPPVDAEVKELEEHTTGDL